MLRSHLSFSSSWILRPYPLQRFSSWHHSIKLLSLNLSSAFTSPWRGEAEIRIRRGFQHFTFPVKQILFATDFHHFK
jgi:hypothetical protein